MGVFFDVPTASRAAIKGVIKDALETDPAAIPNADAAAEEKAAEVAPAGYAKFNAGRFIGALLIFAAIIGAAIGTDAADLGDSSKALYGFGATIFGVVVGFLAGEKTSA